MIRGTNQEFRFKLSCKFDELATVRVVFWQDNNNGPASYRPLPIVKVKAQCSSCNNGNGCSVVLNQEETLRFSDKRKAKAQLRGLTYDGRPISTFEQLIDVYPVKDDSILDDDILPTPTYDDLIILDGQDIIQGR
jgi:hypothetical protein